MKRQADLDQLTTLLGQCLGRIDEQAYRLQRDVDEGDDTDLVEDVLENEAARLQELVGSLLEQVELPDQCDLNRIVDGAVRGCMNELGQPIVVRQRFASALPPVACKPGQLAFAVQRALVLAASNLEVGGDLIVTTRHDGDQLVLEMEANGARRDRHLHHRAQTLCEFVATFRGNCHLAHDDHRSLLIVFELPPALTIDERRSR